MRGLRNDMAHTCRSVFSQPQEMPRSPLGFELAALKGREKPSHTHAISLRVSPGTQPGSWISIASSHVCKRTEQSSLCEIFQQTSSDLNGSEFSSNMGLLHGTRLSLPLRSIVQTVTGCLDHADPKHSMHRAVGRKDSLELTSALNSTPTSPLALQQALEVAQGRRGRQRHLCKAEHPRAHH